MSQKKINNKEHLRITMFPWFAMGHMTPFLHLSNELAKMGHRIMFIVPHKAKVQLQHLNRYPNLVKFNVVTVPHVPGLPRGTETASEIPISLNHLLVEAVDKTREQVEETLKVTEPDLVLYDNAHWIPEAARKFGVKAVCYNVVCAASIAIALVPARNVPKDRPITMEELRVPPEGYPSSKVILSGPEAQSLLFISFPFGEGLTFYERITTALRESDAIAIRTTKEIEANFCDYIASQYNKKVFLTGPVLPLESTQEEKLEPRWAKWLDTFGKGSVVFCAFGSQINLEKNQFQEILLGFELSGFPFLVALKAPNGCESVEEALPKGFEERVKGRGMVTGGWVQQPLLLKHSSVGCFVNHCGFGSMWESLLSDKQIVLVPHLGDQILNTKLLVEELEVAIEVKRDENGWISKENLSQVIKSVMDQGSEVGVKVKKNHAKWRESGGSPQLMNQYINRFVQDLQELHLQCG